MSGPKPKIFPVLMAGGIGSRLWPLSRAAYPKQFLKLNSDQSMLQEAIHRVNSDEFEPVSVICNQDHRFLVAQHFQETGLTPRNIILEAQARGTAFTIAVAALNALEEDKDALIFVLPCDHAIEDQEALRNAALKAAENAAQGKIIVFGVKPDSPKTGYGYINIGTTSDGAAIEKVLNFTEKPDIATALRYINEGTYFWNAGIFLMKAQHILDELQRYAPDILHAARACWADKTPDLDFLRLPEGPLRKCPNISIDYAVLEKSETIYMVPLRTGWSDLGSWKSVQQEFPKDKAGNVCRGDILAAQSRGNLLYAAEGITLTALGIDNLAVVADEDAILVCDLDEAENIGAIVKQLKENGSTKQDEHLQIWRPWGYYKILGRGPGFLLKRLGIHPGSALSLQYHSHRAEHWVVVKGEIDVQRNNERHTLKVNESIYIPIGAHHRIVNNSDETAELIEVQTGDYLAEDDIVRLEDKYKRA